MASRTFRRRRYLLIIILVILSAPLSAQYQIQYPKWYAETKLNHLYLLTGDSTTTYAKDIINIVKTNWKLTPVTVLSGLIPAELMVKGNGFLSVTTYSKIMSKNNTVQYSNDYFHLDIWTVKDEYKPSKDWEDYGFILASAELYNRTIGTGILSNKSGEDFTSELFPLDFLNGMSGNIKNMIQYFNKTIPQNKTIDLLGDREITAELSNLKTDTLYMPNYWYGNANTMLIDPKEAEAYEARTVKYMDNVVKAYPYPIKFVTREELNDKIINAKSNIYYFNIIQSSADKIVSVINGYTGDVLYSETTRKSYRIKAGDLENLGKAIK